MSNNLLPAFYAQNNTYGVVEKVRNLDNFGRYIDVVYEVIRTQSQMGRLGAEIAIKHKLVEDIPVELVALILGKELTEAGYKIQFRQRGFRKKKKSIIVYWGLPEEDKCQNGQ